MKIIFPLLILLNAGITSCSHKSNTNNNKITGDYLIIGQACGAVFLTKTTVTYYLISNNQLSEDTTVSVYAPPATISKFNFNIVMPASKYDSVKYLLYSIPTELLNPNNPAFGNYSPHACYTDIRTSINGVAYEWHFFEDYGAGSSAFHQFMDSIRLYF